MRRLAIALAAGGIALFGFAAPAQADPVCNADAGTCTSPGAGYGRCVSDDIIQHPSDRPVAYGPSKINSQGKVTGAVNAYFASDGNSHFDTGAGIACPKPVE
jgi:hypothetical protein